jgi:cyclopropane fatty-acyl-phospholipid synthase-like methyltransferase
MNFNLYENSADYYDTLYKPLKDEIKFYKRYIKTGYKILDLGCGTGRVCIELAKQTRKCTFDCVDYSEKMMQIFKNKLNRMKKTYTFTDSITLIHEDMLKYKSEKKYDLIIFPFQSIQCLKKNQITKQLINCKNMLNNNGKIIINTFDPSMSGYSEHAEILNGLGVDEQQNLVISFITKIKYTEEEIEYTQVTKKYSKEGLLISKLEDYFIISNLSYEYISEIYKGSGLSIVNIFTDYKRNNKLSAKKDFIGIFQYGA